MIFQFLHLFAGPPCEGGSFLGFPTWYKYLPSVDGVPAGEPCTAQVAGLSDIWLIAAAVLEIMLRLAALIAVGFVVYGGIRYIVSQGEPEKTGKSLHTILNALIGLVISIVATALVTFIAGRFN